MWGEIGLVRVDWKTFEILLKGLFCMSFGGSTYLEPAPVEDPELSSTTETRHSSSWILIQRRKENQVPNNKIWTNIIAFRYSAFITRLYCMWLRIMIYLERQKFMSDRNITTKVFLFYSLINFQKRWWGYLMKTFAFSFLYLILYP